MSSARSHSKARSKLKTRIARKRRNQGTWMAAVLRAEQQSTRRVRKVVAGKMQMKTEDVAGRLVGGKRR